MAKKETSKSVTVRGPAANLPTIELNVEDIKKYICPNATDKEFELFMGICKSYALNPFKREIHFVKYGSKDANTIVGYEVYLKRANGTGLLSGWDVEIVDEGARAKITIHRKDWEAPFVWYVDREEFDKKQSTWNAMPNFMLKKVAIAQGMRLAFPDELGGLPYIPEELPDDKTGRITSESLPKTVEAEVVEEPPETKEQPPEQKPPADNKKKPAASKSKDSKSDATAEAKAKIEKARQEAAAKVAEKSSDTKAAFPEPTGNLLSEVNLAKIEEAFAPFDVDMKLLERYRQLPKEQWTISVFKELRGVKDGLADGTFTKELIESMIEGEDNLNM